MKLRGGAAMTPASSDISDPQVASQPHVVIPKKRPSQERIQAGELVGSTSTTNSSDGLHFDACMPGCETRDRLVVGKTPAAGETNPAVARAEGAEMDDRDTASEIGISALNGAAYVLTQTAALPLTALKLGRNAVVDVSRLK
jgi:hypothetical protein